MGEDLWPEHGLSRLVQDGGKPLPKEGVIVGKFVQEVVLGLRRADDNDRVAPSGKREHDLEEDAVDVF